MGLAAVGHHRVFGRLTAGRLFFASDRLGKQWVRLREFLLRRNLVQSAVSPFNILGN